MSLSVKNELARLKAVVRRLDRQTVFVLLVSVLLVFVQLSFGSRRFFREHLEPIVPADWQVLRGWGWWFGIQGLTGFVLPVLFLLLLFRRRPSEIGLGLGDVRLAAWVALLYLPVVTVGTWVLSDQTAFQAQYPHLREATADWGLFLFYHGMFLLYWIGWEYLWRGFVLFGTARTFGVYAVFVQAVPFALLHANKPGAEAVLSVVGGVALGALVWRCRSFWIAVPIHAVQMLLLDLFSTLRVRSGASGVGLDALMEILRSL